MPDINRTNGLGLTVVVATYNERDTLPDLLNQLWDVLPDAKVLVVDDNSPDGTGRWVREMQSRESRVELLHRENQRGLGTATMAGISRALSNNAEWIATMDADLSHNPADLAAMWQHLYIVGEQAIDVLIGSRYIDGGRIENWPRRRKLTSRLVNAFSRYAVGLAARDNSSALRIYRGTALKSIELARVNAVGYVYLEQILLYLQQLGAKIEEYPITFRDRKSGRSKVGVWETARSLRDIVWLALRSHSIR